jgi:hypothetical protein
LSNQLSGQSPAGAEAGIPVKAKAPPPPSLRYLGFRTTAEGREYTLRVTAGFEHRDFVLLITHQDFASREARFQDAPDLCFAKLQRDLVADPGLAPGSRLVVTTRDFLEYRLAQKPAPSRKRPPPPPAD